MTRPWDMISSDEIDVVAPDATVRSRVKGYYSGKQFIIDDMSVDVRPGDEIRRMLPNGREEAFTVEDPKFYGNGPFGAHYQVAVSRRGTFDKHTGGHYHITVSGSNSRVNIGSADNSSNTVAIKNEELSVLAGELARLREAVARNAQSPEQYVAIGAIASAELAAAAGDTSKVKNALSAMGSAGRWVLDTAKEIGVKVAGEALRQQLGLPPS